MKKFTIIEHGYNPEEVNSFVERVAKEYETVLTKLRERDNDAKSLELQIKEANIEITSLKDKLASSESDIEFLKQE